MDHIQTIEKLQKLRLEAMASLHQQHVNDASTDTFTIDEYLALLVDYLGYELDGAYSFLLTRK